MQTEALLHLETKATDLPVPRIFPALSGATDIGLAFDDGSTRTVRLLSYLEGRRSTPPPHPRRYCVTLAIAQAGWHGA
jgi:Ser/Thr protein kinase RdoA (MazF antagonist)